jgi:uncharacterized protein (DUF1697 family)
VPAQIALLRAVNVGGRSIAMADLKAMFDALGFANVRTLLQSGNVVFESGQKNGAALESLLEAETAKRLGIACDYLVRSTAQWSALAAGNPFPDVARRDPGHLVLMPLKTAPSKQEVAALQAAITGRETVRAKGQALYIVYPDGQGRSKLTISVIEKKLNTRGTCRNWNTTLKLLALAQGPSAKSSPARSVRDGKRA